MLFDNCFKVEHLVKKKKKLWSSWITDAGKLVGVMFPFPVAFTELTICFSVWWKQQPFQEQLHLAIRNSTISCQKPSLLTDSNLDLLREMRLVRKTGIWPGRVRLEGQKVVASRAVLAAGFEACTPSTFMKNWTCAEIRLKDELGEWRGQWEKNSTYSC